MIWMYCPAELEHGGGVRRAAFPRQIKGNQRIRPPQQYRDANAGDNDRKREFEAECLLKTFPIACADELRAEYARAGYRAEHGQIEHEQQLIGDSHAGHLACTDRPDHDGIQQVDEV